MSVLVHVCMAVCLSLRMSLCLCGLSVCLSMCVVKDQDSNEPEPSDWERYAAEEYELLVAEEGATDTQRDDPSVLSDVLFRCFSHKLLSSQPSTS